jgi:ssRNA-specific RNase YbeY (16S rRNA maturation enzyme)
MKFYIGAYYLIKLNKVEFGEMKHSEIHTCSTCINHSFFDAWSIPWTEDGKNINEEIKRDFNLNEPLIKKIQTWSNQKFEDKKIGWICTFSDLDTLVEYKDKFFSNEKEYQILSINFPKPEREVLLKVFNPDKTSLGEIGLSQNLNNQISENENEETLGYDLIGIEQGGDFHTFHCHDLASELIEKFGVEINEFGLLKENSNWRELVEYMNNEENGCEPTPWFYVKVKRTNENSQMHNKV